VHTNNTTEESTMEKAQQIAQLNDALRQTMTGGKVILTNGVASSSEEVIAAVTQKVRSYNAFDPEDGDDPYGEHDFGAFDHEGTKYYWKIDYYDNTMEYLSEDPEDPAKTNRVLTILLASEY